MIKGRNPLSYNVYFFFKYYSKARRWRICFEKCAFGRLLSVFVLENWKTKWSRRLSRSHKTRSRDIPNERSLGPQYPPPFGQHSGNPTAGTYKHGEFMYTYACLADYFVNVYSSFSRNVFDSYRIFGRIYSAMRVSQMFIAIISSSIIDGRAQLLN